MSMRIFPLGVTLEQLEVQHPQHLILLVDPHPAEPELGRIITGAHRDCVLVLVDCTTDAKSVLSALASRGLRLDLVAIAAEAGPIPDFTWARSDLSHPLALWRWLYRVCLYSLRVVGYTDDAELFARLSMQIADQDDVTDTAGLYNIAAGLLATTTA